MSSGIPESVKKLIATSIDSVPELEAILLLRQEHDHAWSDLEAGQRLYVSKTVAAHILAVLAERGFFACEDDRYTWAPATRELESAVADLAVAYSRHLVAVTQLVHTKPPEGARQFADAFRLRKDK
jgi:hypothetical protein